MSRDWRSMKWPLAALPFNVWRLLCDSLDYVPLSGNGYPLLADILKYLPKDIELFRVRCGHNDMVPNSPTHMLLMDYAQNRNGTIQAIQLALENMNHIAADIIPRHLRSVYNSVVNYFRQYEPLQVYPGDHGRQQTEHSVCNCPNCNPAANMYPNRQGRVPPGYPDGNCPPPYSPPYAGTRNRIPAGPQQYTDLNNRIPAGPQQYTDPNNRIPAGPQQYTDPNIPVRRVPEHTRQFNDGTGLPHEQTSRHSVHQSISSEARPELYQGVGSGCGYTPGVCEHCRINSDPDQTAVMSVSGEKTATCQCLRLTSVFRQSPIGDSLSDDSPVNSSSSNSMNECNVTNNGSRRTSGQRQSRPPTDNDRRSWPSSCSSESSGELRNFISDSQLEQHEQHRGTNEPANQSETSISHTMYGIISGSNLSDRGLQFNNNLDTDDGENVPGENEHIVQNIAPSNSMNETNTRQTSVPADPPSISPGGNSRRLGETRKRVFVTYAWNSMTNSQIFLEEVVQLCLELKQAGATVKIDMDQSSYSALRLNKLDWIETHMSQADYVVVCITPTYKKDIKPQQRGASPRSSQLNARYVFDKLRHEYYKNNSVNYRVIPVIFTNHRTTENHVPECMRTTLIHSYPNSNNSVTHAVFGRGQYRPS